MIFRQQNYLKLPKNKVISLNFNCTSKITASNRQWVTAYFNSTNCFENMKKTLYICGQTTTKARKDELIKL